VAVTRFFIDHGMSLKKAHNVLERISTGRTVPVVLFGDLNAIVSELLALGVLAAPIQAPQVNLKQIREALDLTQNEFATLYDIELDTLQNWEQGRNIPDKGTMHFYKFVQAFPGLSIKLVTGGRLSGAKFRPHYHYSAKIAGPVYSLSRNPSNYVNWTSGTLSLKNKVSD
jgi:DNA-binding transcriptional regulator YiaG